MERLQTLANTDKCFFVAGLPAPLTPEDWKRYHLQSFPAFAGTDKNDILQEIIDAVYTMFAGLPNLWAMHNPQVYFDKTRLCYRLLIAWYIADLYPEYANGILTNSGLPITRKKIGPIDIQFNEDATMSSDKDLLASLRSNAFGVKAYMMIKTSMVRLRLYTRDRNYIGVPVYTLHKGKFYNGEFIVE